MLNYHEQKNASRVPDEQRPLTVSHLFYMIWDGVFNVAIDLDVNAKEGTGNSHSFY